MNNLELAQSAAELLANTQSLTVTFGKHAGKTLEQIAQEAPGYISWFAENFDPQPYPRMKAETVEHNKALRTEAVRRNIVMREAARAAKAEAEKLQTEFNQETSNSTFIGELKKRDTFTGTVVALNRSGSVEVDIDGNIALVYLSAEVGETITFKGTPVRHFEQMGIKKTYMNRLTIL